MWAPELSATPRPVAAASPAPLHHEHQMRPRPYVVGYSGYIPGLMFQYGRTFAKAAEDCVVTFLKQQEGRQTTRQVEAERRCKSLPRMRSARGVDDSKGVQPAFTYALDETYPPLPGYTGHIRNVNRSTIIGRSVASATRREREKSFLSERSTETTQERSVERYQEQTASSRAKQVKMVRSIHEVERQDKPAVSTTTDAQQEILATSASSAVDVEELEHESSAVMETRSVPQEESSSSSTIRKVVRHEAAEGSKSQNTDTVKMILAGQIICDACDERETDRSTSSHVHNTSDVSFSETKVRSASAESHRNTTFSRSFVQKSASMNVRQRDSSSHVKHSTVAKTPIVKGALQVKHTSPSKSKESSSATQQSSPSKRTGPVSKTTSVTKSKVQTKSLAASTTRNTSSSTQKKTNTKQTSRAEEVSKSSRPATTAKTQTSVQPSEDTSTVESNVPTSDPKSSSVGTKLLPEKHVTITEPKSTSDAPTLAENKTSVSETAKSTPGVSFKLEKESVTSESKESSSSAQVFEERKTSTITEISTSEVKSELGTSLSSASVPYQADSEKISTTEMTSPALTRSTKMSPVFEKHVNLTAATSAREGHVI